MLPPLSAALPRRMLSSRMFSSATRLSSRGRALAAGGGAAASVWEAVNALAAKPGNINVRECKSKCTANSNLLTLLLNRSRIHYFASQMGQGFPDFEGSPIARAAAAEAIREGTAALNQYSPQPGLPSLRRSVSEFVRRRYDVRALPPKRCSRSLTLVLLSLSPMMTTTTDGGVYRPSMSRCRR